MQKPRLEINMSQIITQRMTEQLTLSKHDLVTLLINFNDIKHDLKDIKTRLKRKL